MATIIIQVMNNNNCILAFNFPVCKQEFRIVQISELELSCPIIDDSNALTSKNLIGSHIFTSQGL